MLNFGEVLADFKEKEDPVSIAPLMDDPSLISGLAAWQSVKVNIKQDQIQQNIEQDNLSKWEWLWSQCSIDLDKFAMVSNIPYQNVDNLFTRLKGLRLIYPDGTVNNLAKQFVQAMVLSKLPKKKAKKEETNAV